MAKALELATWSWHDIEIVGGGGAAARSGSPGRPRARARSSASTVEVSLTHTRGMAGAVAVLTDEPPALAEPLLDAEQMRATDEWAIETSAVPSLELMERAGEGLADAVSRHAPAGRVAVVCGKGNNGGDGLVAARLLRQAGRQVDVLLVVAGRVAAGRREGDAQAAVRAGAGAVRAEALKGANVIVDALLGTGFEGAPRKPADKVITAINAAKARVVAADVPSGVNASTGQVEGEAVEAIATATFHRAKPGLWISPGKEYAGDVDVIDIGIPRGGPAKAEAG